MRFLADENVAASVVDALRNAGHDVLDIKEEGLYGIADTLIIRKARSAHRIILTHDSDFLYQHIAPVILLRFRNQKPTNVSKNLLQFVQSAISPKIQNKTIVILTEWSAEIIRR